MSYGKGIGEAYVSDITLAFLADTGHYVVNGSRAGSLATDLSVAGTCGGTGSTVMLDFIFGNSRKQSVRCAWACGCE